MADNMHELIRRLANSSGQAEPDNPQAGKQAPNRLNLPSLATVQKVYTTSSGVPEIRPEGHDCLGRGDAQEAQRELSTIALRAKSRVAIEAVCSVGTCALFSFDRGRDGITDIYHDRSR